MKITISISISELGKAIHRARTSKGHSQKYLGEMIGISHARISEIENQSQGKDSVPLAHILSLEKYLNTELVPFKELM